MPRRSSGDLEGEPADVEDRLRMVDLCVTGLRLLESSALWISHHVDVDEDWPMRFVLDLPQVGREDLERVGGKAANLGELIQAGFPVPPGFVVGTAAYDRLVEADRLSVSLDRGLAEGDGTLIRAAFQTAPIPSEVEREILEAYAVLGGGPVAVRSSATAEDLPEAAFAGQQDTFLNVVGPEALLDATRRCWASLWTDRAIAYRARLGLEQREVKLAVVLQRMVDAEHAGVLFTANPVTGAEDEVVVDASPGLGEAVVSGLVTPHHLVLRRRWLGRWGWRVVERRSGRGEVVVRPREGGGTEQVDGSASRDGPALPERALGELAGLGEAIEGHFGRPQDIEWAWAEGRPFVLQARPITALPEPLPPPGRARRLVAGLMAEQLPDRPYPLEMTTWVSAVYDFLGGLLFGLFGLRALPLDHLFAEEEGVAVRLRGRVSIRPTPAVLTAPVRLFRLARRHDPGEWRDDPLLAEARERARELERRELGELTWEGLLATVDEALGIVPLVGELRLRYSPRAILAVARLRALLALLGRGGHFPTLVFSGVETKVLETNRALEALAERIRSHPVLFEAFTRHRPDELWGVLEGEPAGRPFLRELEAFLDRYGHREAGATLSVSQSTWKDEPQVVLGLLGGLARGGERPKPERPAWEASRDEVLAHPLLRLPPLRGAFLGLLERARYFPELREDTRFYLMLPLPALRRALIELGRRLGEIAVLDHPEEVLHLRWDELRDAGDGWPPPARVAEELRSLVVRRKARRAELEGTPWVDPRLFGRTEVEGEGGVLLRGTPASPGTAEGPVRVIRDPSEFGRLRSGEVLVAPYTNPAWTPLFERAAAVVVDSGGPASHAAIVAREYGIPAVMATGEGTRLLTDGRPVLVDGTRGIVVDPDGGDQQEVGGGDGDDPVPVR